jgi:flagellar export protein FliJ
MTLRRKKVQKVLEVREQALNERAGVLVQAHEGRELAQNNAICTANHLAEATEYRNRLASRSINVASWIDAEQWLAQRNNQHDIAQVELHSAELYVVRAHEQVVAARSNVKRIELLDQRLANGEMRQQLRVEQRNNDEHAQRHFANARRSDSG